MDADTTTITNDQALRILARGAMVSIMDLADGQCQVHGEKKDDVRHVMLSMFLFHLCKSVKPENREKVAKIFDLMAEHIRAPL